MVEVRPTFVQVCGEEWGVNRDLVLLPRIKLDFLSADNSQYRTGQVAVKLKYGEPAFGA